MKKLLLFTLLLALSVTAVRAQESAVEEPALRDSKFDIAVEAVLAPGFNDYCSRSMQVSGVATLNFGRYMSAGFGLGFRHSYVLERVDQNIHAVGEPDKKTRSNRLLLPIYLRVKGYVPAGSFAFKSTRWSPFAMLDLGYAVDMQQSTRTPTAFGPFLEPAAGLDVLFPDGRLWYLSLGLGIQSAQCTVVDNQGGHARPVARLSTGKALSLNLRIGYRF